MWTPPAMLLQYVAQLVSARALKADGGGFKFYLKQQSFLCQLDFCKPAERRTMLQTSFPASTKAFVSYSTRCGFHTVNGRQYLWWRPGNVLLTASCLKSFGWELGSGRQFISNLFQKHTHLRTCILSTLYWVARTRLCTSDPLLQNKAVFVTRTHVQCIIRRYSMLEWSTCV